MPRQYASPKPLIPLLRTTSMSSARRCRTGGATWEFRNGLSTAIDSAYVRTSAITGRRALSCRIKGSAPVPGELGTGPRRNRLRPAHRAGCRRRSCAQPCSLSTAAMSARLHLAPGSGSPGWPRQVTAAVHERRSPASAGEPLAEGPRGGGRPGAGQPEGHDPDRQMLTCGPAAEADSGRAAT